MAKSIARLAADLADATAAGDTTAIAEIRAAAHNHPSTRSAIRALDGAGSATRGDVKHGTTRRA